MTKIDEFKKLLKERLDQADDDIYCTKIAIAELFIKNHRLHAGEGIELLDYCDSTNDWDDVVDLMIGYECANAVKEELSLLSHFIERGFDIKEVKKDKKPSIN
ncbi:hypothetical protein IJ182_04940 [bacterium]|nr:hypothetical protein [bacterium]